MIYNTHRITKCEGKIYIWSRYIQGIHCKKWIVLTQVLHYLGCRQVLRYHSLCGPSKAIASCLSAINALDIHVTFIHPFLCTHVMFVFCIHVQVEFQPPSSLFMIATRIHEGIMKWCSYPDVRSFWVAVGGEGACNSGSVQIRHSVFWVSCLYCFASFTLLGPY